ncbi:MAG: phosphoribosylformylglycinamidine synthase subunit PurS [Pseudomonadota bacterium]
MKARVEIGLKPGVLDPEAVVIQNSLHNLGFDGVDDVRRLKVIELDVPASDRMSAETRIESMCERLLANPVIETYTITLLED